MPTGRAVRQPTMSGEPTSHVRPPSRTSDERSAEGTSPSRPRTSHGPKRQIAKYPEGRQASAVIPLLWRAQEQHGGWLPQAAIRARRRHARHAATSARWKSRPSTRCSTLAPVGKKAHIQVCGTTPCRAARRRRDLIKVCQKRIGEPEPGHRRRQFLLGRGRVPGRLRERADGPDLEGHLRGPDGRKLRARCSTASRPASRRSPVRRTAASSRRRSAARPR